MAQVTERIRDITAPEGGKRPDQQTVKAVGGGMSASAVIGLGTLALGVVGLVGILPFTLLYIAVIAAGAAMVIEAGAFAAKFNDAVAAISRNRGEEIAVETGISAEALGGVAALALGILALVGIHPLLFASIAMIVVGAALILDVMPKARMSGLMRSGFYDTGASAQETVMAGTGSQFLLGIGVLALGILAVVGIAPLMLDLVAAIAIGCAIALGSGAIGYRTFRSLHS
jgi:hypothetical protein